MLDALLCAIDGISIFIFFGFSLVGFILGDTCGIFVGILLGINLVGLLWVDGLGWYIVYRNLSR